MVDDQEIDAGGDGFLERDETGVHGGADFGDAAVVGELQAVEGAGGVFVGGAAGAFVAVSDEVGQRGHAG